METPLSVTHIGKYEILAELGRGGMGVVYRAEDKNIGREVAIKTLTEATPELRQRFLVEARSGVLNHQNIVTVYDFGEQDGNPYMVMEFLQGDTLEKILRGNRPLSLVEKLDIVRQICEGLAYAHSKGVVHRDIKPANIMVLLGGQIKIVDFGIARLESSSGQTKTGAVIGTFHYIAPERLKGDPSDGRADIWAAGILLYQMLTGALPFAGEDVSALHKVVNEPYPPLKNHLTDYPTALDQILDRALAKHPDDRYAAAEEMASDIEAVNDVLKRARVGETLSYVRGLLEEEQLTAARPALLELQRLDPQNGEIRRLLREVQERLSRQQRTEQARQTLNLAEEAVLAQRFTEALELYKQTAKIDPAVKGLTEKIEYVRGLKEKVDRVASLQLQAREARHRNDFAAASQLLDQALQLDERNTDLRNEKAGLLQEQERAAKEGLRRKLKESGRDSLSGRSFTQAIQLLRQALEIDPTDSEAQIMFQEALARQEDERRRKVIDQIVAEIQECVYRGELQHSLDLIQRALEKLPAETVLLRLKTETEKKLLEENARKLVEATSLTVQTMLASDPQEALSCVLQALGQQPGEPRLLDLQQLVTEQLKKANLAGLRAQYLKSAQEAIDKGEFDQAISTLETAALDCGQSPEITYFGEYARSEKMNRQKKAAAAAALDQAHRLLASEDLEGATAVLASAAKETSDPAVEQLLRQTREQLEETTRRWEAVVARVQSLSEIEPQQALHLLANQPAAVQQRSPVKALRVKLDALIDRQKALRTAIDQSRNLEREGDLRGGMEVLEAVQRAYGSSPELTAALGEFTKRRERIASDKVRQSIGEARQAILNANGPLALDELRKSAEVLEFAEPALQTDWNRLGKEASRTQPEKSSNTATLPTMVSGKSTSTWMLAGMAAVAFAVAGIAGWLFTRGSHAGPLTFLQLNAAPFAEVVSVTGKGGKAFALPNGEHTTPLRLEGLPEGSYTVVFKAPDGSSHTQICKPSDDHLCVADLDKLSDAQIDEILTGDK